MNRDALWWKSSYSNGSGNCVEVASFDHDRVAVRDSKDRAGPMLVVSAAEWGSFLVGVVAGEFDRG